jgi:hypothetical protein
MDALKSEINKNRTISETTLMGYLSIIEKITKELTTKPFALTILNNYKEVIKILEKKPLNTSKNYISAILVALAPKKKSPEKKYINSYNLYLKRLTELNKEYITDKEKQLKSDKEQKEWVEWPDLIKVFDTLRKKIRHLNYNSNNTTLKKKKHFILLQKYLVAGLYLLQPPRRNEYADMIIIRQHPTYPQEYDINSKYHNYLVVHSRNKKTFIFNRYKTSSTYGQQKIKVNKKLNSILNLWLLFNKTPYLLLNINKTQLSSNGLTKFLQKTFAPTGKKISSIMLRHIYLSYKYGKDTPYIQKKSDAILMGHSVITQQQIYTKIN